jgi:mono/diheme cytochrome c family protein
MRCLTILAVAAYAACAAQHAYAQKAGDARIGFDFARKSCADCHAVAGKELSSPNPAAPSFQSLAATPGMTETALYVALQTSHRTMPNLRLEAGEMRDVVAYILSLKP